MLYRGQEQNRILEEVSNRLARMLRAITCRENETRNLKHREWKEKRRGEKQEEKGEKKRRERKKERKVRRRYERMDT